MSQMFQSASEFNKQLNWNVSNVTDRSHMFLNNKFNEYVLSKYFECPLNYNHIYTRGDCRTAINNVFKFKDGYGKIKNTKKYYSDKPNGCYKKSDTRFYINGESESPRSTEPTINTYRRPMCIIKG